MEMCLQPCGCVEVVVTGRKIGLWGKMGVCARAITRLRFFRTWRIYLFFQNFVPRIFIIIQCPKTTRIFRTKISLVGPLLILSIYFLLPRIQRSSAIYLFPLAMATVLPPLSKRQRTEAAERSREQQNIEEVPSDAGSLRLQFFDETTGLPIGQGPVLVPVADANPKNLELLLNTLQGHVSMNALIINILLRS
jgi:hypothetical protein